MQKSTFTFWKMLKFQMRLPLACGEALSVITMMTFRHLIGPGRNIFLTDHKVNHVILYNCFCSFSFFS